MPDTPDTPQRAPSDSSFGVEGNTSNQHQKKKRKQRKPPAVAWKKPKGMPKRPLSAYNLFFKEQREVMMSARADAVKSDVKKRSKKETVGIGFANLARTIADKWQSLDAPNKAVYIEMASKEKERYNREMLVWRAKQKEEKERKAATAALSSPRIVHDDTRIHPSLLHHNALSNLARQQMNLNNPLLREVSASAMMPAAHLHHLRQGQAGSQNTLFPDSWFELQQPRSSTSSSTNNNTTTRTPGVSRTNRFHHHHYPNGDPNLFGGDLNKLSPNNSAAQIRLLMQQQQHQREHEEYMASGLSLKNAALGIAKSPYNTNSAVSTAQSSSLSHLASKLDNDTIRFLTEFRFSNGSSSGESDEQEQAVSK